MMLTIAKLTKEVQENKQKVKVNYQEVERKLERVEERYITEEITPELYVKHAEKFKQEKVGLLKELTKLEGHSSSHEEIVDHALGNAVNISKMWLSGEYKDKIRVQNWIFPEGLIYNKKKDTVRTPKINQAYAWMACQQQVLSKIKSGIPLLNIGYSALVVPPGIEPLLGKP